MRMVRRDTVADESKRRGETVEDIHMKTGIARKEGSGGV